jgi:hypothetical protein
MRVVMAPQVVFLMTMLVLLSRCGRRYTYFYAWERSGKSDETTMGEEKKETSEKMLPKRQTKGSQSWIRGENIKGR